MGFMSVVQVEKILYWIIRVGAYALPFTVLIIANSMFFPFISGKNFLFRIIVEIMTTAWVGLLIIHFRKYWPRWGLLTTAFAVFVLAIFISAVFGVHFSQSFWSNFERMDGVITQLHLLFLFLALSGVFKTRREWFSFFAASIIASVCVALYGFLEYFGFVNDIAESSRIISTLGNPLYVAAYLSFHIFLLVYLMTEVKSVLLKWLLYAVFCAELVAVFLTLGRGAFIGLIAGGSIVLLAFLFTAENVKKRVVFASLMIVLLAMPVFFYMLRNAEFVKSSDIFLRFSNITLEAGQARFIIWGMAFDAFKEKPLLGWGSDNFIVPFGKYYNPKAFGLEPWYDRTHNMPLEWLVAGGAVGFSAYVFLLFAVLWAIAKAARAATFSKKQAFIFVGMIVAYIVQLLFVFDTLGTYLMFALFAGFFYSAGSYQKEWRDKNSLFSVFQHKEKDIESYKGSMSRVYTVVGIFIVAIFVVYGVSIRPLMANYVLMSALTYFNQGKLSESYESFQKALTLSKGTIGETEIAEHLAFNVYKLFSHPEFLRKPEGENFYRLTRDTLEEEIARGSKKYPNIKHHILLAQLYHQKAVLDGDAGALQKAFEQYEKVILDAAPNYVSVYPIYANLLAQTGNFTGAIILSQKASAILESAEKYDAQFFYSVPLFYAAAKQYDDAYTALAAISKKYGTRVPGKSLDPEMMERIVSITGSHGKSAIPFLKQVYDLDKSLLSVVLMLAQLNASDGSKSEARFYAVEALKLDSSLEGRVSEFLKAVEDGKIKK